MIPWFTLLGHMIRDGWPKLPATHLARLAGGLIVFAGCLPFAPLWLAALMGAAVMVGFYTDQKHGEAARGDWGYGILSGCTSLVPLGLAAGALIGAPAFMLIGLGGIKPPIWKAAWALDPLRFAAWVPEWAEPVLEPTRIAAIAWGGVVGLIVAFIVAATQGAF